MTDSIPVAADSGGRAPPEGGATEDGTATGDASANIERYVQERLLGQGAMGAVYLVRDRETGEQLALKKLFRMDGKSALRVKREFRSIGDLSHPNLVKVYELGRAPDGWFLAMEYLEGEDLQAYLGFDADKASSRIDSALADALRQRTELQERLIPAFYQLASGVHALHRASMLHRDLKPSNVLVSNHRVVVLDFGLVRELDQGASTLTEEGGIAGTPAYMAPEQALGKALTEASDWYAFGVMLYEALTGELPADGPLLELLRGKLERDPVPPIELNPEVPAKLSRLCMSLLARDPSARPSGRDVLTALAPVSTQPGRAPTAPTGETSLLTENADKNTQPAFFGRAAEVEALKNALLETEGGKTVVAHVRGTSGAGKSVLVEQFLDQVDLYSSALRQADALVLRSRCYEREAMPFKALDGVIDALSRHLAHLDDVEVGNLLPTQIGALAQLFPVLERLRAVQHLLSVRKRGSSDDAVQNRQRAEGALRELFARLSERRPVVIWIDDLQWGDLDSARILSGWLRSASNLPLLLVLSYRSDEVETSECLRLLLGPSGESGGAAEHMIAVSPLAAADVHALCEQQLAELAHGRPELVERIVREAQGSPFLANQLAALAKAKLLRGDVDLTELTIGDVVAQTGAMLPREGRYLLSVLAVAGRPIPPKLAMRAADLRHGGRELVHALRRLQLVRTREVAGERLLEVYHDRVREAVQRNLRANQLERIHGSLLAALEYSGRADPDWLHSLALGAGQRVAALRYGLTAAERAKGTLAFERAAELYACCLDLVGDSPEDRCELWRKLADALGSCGRGARAADAYLEAANLEQDRREVVRLMRLATSHLLRSGRFEQGEELLQRVLSAMELKLPRTRAGLLAALLWERLRAKLRGQHYTQRREEEIPVALLTQIDAYQALREETAPIDPLRGALFGAFQARAAIKSGEPLRVVRMLCGESYLASLSGSPRAARRSDQLLAQAGLLADKLGTPAAHAAVRGGQALAHWMLGRAELVLDPAAEAEQIFRTLTQNHAEASYHMRIAVASARIGALFELGNYEAFAQELQSVLAEARATDNIAAQLHLAVNETLLDELNGNGDGMRARLEQQRLQLPRGRFGVYHALHMMSVTVGASFTGDYAWALRCMEEDWPRFVSSPLSRTAQLAFLTRMGRCRLLLSHHFAQGGSGSIPSRIQVELRQLEKLKSKRAAAFLYSQRGRIAYHAGDRTKAIAEFRGVIELGQLSRVEELRVRYALGLLLGGDEGKQLISECERVFVERGVHDPIRYMRGYYPELISKG